MCPPSKVTQYGTKAWPLKLGQIYYPETLVNKYETIPRNFPEERTSETDSLHDKPAYVHIIIYWTNQEVLCSNGTRNSMTGVQNHHLKLVQSMPTTNIFSHVLSSRSCPHPCDYQRQVFHTFLILQHNYLSSNDITFISSSYQINIRKASYHEIPTNLSLFTPWRSIGTAEV